MAAFRHFGFAMRRAFGGVYHFAKFGWSRCSSFDNVHAFSFREFGLKVTIHAPKITVLEDSNETLAPIANLPNSAQLGQSLPLPQVTSGSVQ